MRILFAGLFAALTLSGYSQEPLRSSTTDHKTKSTYLGFKAGYNRTDISGVETDGDETGYVGGELYAGFFADTRLNTHLHFQNELLFSWTNDFHYVEIPLHLKYYFSQRKWALFGGPRLDIIADDDNKKSETGYQFQNFGVSGELGLQYHFAKKFFVESRFAKGFSKQVTDHFLDINNGKRNTIRIGAGIRF